MKAKYEVLSVRRNVASLTGRERRSGWNLTFEIDKSKYMSLHTLETPASECCQMFNAANGKKFPLTRGSGVLIDTGLK